MIKTIKTAFLATAALTAVSSVAYADALVDLKSIISKLSDSDALYQTAVQVPGGYSISPTADAAPADASTAVEEPFTEVKVSGYIKAGYIYSEIRDGSPSRGLIPHDSSSDFDAEAGVNVKGSVQSSLGEVGVTIQSKWDLAESANNAATTSLRDEGAIGFWQFSDSMKLEMGRANGGRMENGIDKNTRRIWTIGNRRVRSENAGNGFFDRDMYNGFMGLVYASGPLTLTVRAHDATRGVGAGGFDDDAIGVSGKAVYSGEAVSVEAAGGYWNQDDAGVLALTSQTGVKWLAGVGTELNFIPNLPLSFAVQTGELHNGTSMVKVSGSTSVALSDTINFGIGAGWTKVDDQVAGLAATYAAQQGFSNHIERVVTGGIYYTPLAQMTIGLEGEWYDDGLSATYSNDGLTGTIVTRYAF